MNATPSHFFMRFVSPALAAVAFVLFTATPSAVGLTPASTPSATGADDALHGEIVRASCLLADTQPGSKSSASLRLLTTKLSQYDKAEFGPESLYKFVLSPEVTIGLLENEQGCVTLIGGADQGKITLADATSLVDASKSPAEWDALIRQGGEWLKTVSTSPGNEIIVLTNQAGAHITVALSAERRKALGLEWLSHATINSQNNESSTASQSGKVESLYTTTDAPSLLRWVELSPSGSHEECSGRVGVLSYRPQHRRYEGAMAKDSPWPDRRALAAFFASLPDDVLWWEPNQFDRLAPYIRTATGKEMSEEGFRAIMVESFGSFEGAKSVASIGVEFLHIPVVWSATPQSPVGFGLVLTSDPKGRQFDWHCGKIVQFTIPPQAAADGGGMWIIGSTADDRRPPNRYAVQHEPAK